jgi:hypothetical protein
MYMSPAEYSELGAIGVSLFILYKMFIFLTKEVIAKFDALHKIVVALIDAKNAQNNEYKSDFSEMTKEFNKLKLDILGELKYIKGKLDAKDKKAK